MKKIFFIVCPYLSILIIFAVFFKLGTYVSNNHLSSLYISLSANAIFIFIAYFTYEILILKSKKELNKELILYVKHNIDSDILIILYTISKLINPSDKANNVVYISNMMRMKKNEIKHKINKDYIGFKLFKDWAQIRSSFDEFLHNNFVLNKFDNDYILNILKLKNHLTLLESLLVHQDNLNLIKNHEDMKNYKVVKVSEIDPNTETPNKYILLKNTDKANQAIIKDFGDFEDKFRVKLNEFYKIKQEKIEEISIVIYNILHLIKHWINTTGGYGEFIGFKNSVIDKTKRS